ncbi:benenodin family lasso peptide [Sphingomonas immobilis]|uniref:Benenodin family lasso peptide n=1 Tax=Sphingomonas immobilis TaxID=3063997 RepID=A0ABT9A3N8_9SPHN|nr:benenodin family lasso peptide [Sphingomonas sp. CA1-15]MDO7843591.1 benenodin family lasso peptide [Sphingomonas sp. CA1-15]
MERDDILDVIELGTASEATKGVGGPVGDGDLGQMHAGLADD